MKTTVVAEFHTECHINISEYTFINGKFVGGELYCRNKETYKEMTSPIDGNYYLDNVSVNKLVDDHRKCGADVRVE